MAAATKTKEPTALAVIPKDNYLALRDGSEIREALSANMANGETFDESLLIRVPTPSGGGTRWAIPEPLNEDTDAITGVLALVANRIKLLKTPQLVSVGPPLSRRGGL